MAQSKLKTRSPVMQAILGFVLGAVGGCVLGATEGPVNEALTEMTSGALLEPVLEWSGTVGPLGLGTLLGASALTIAMSSVVGGVVMAAAAASVLLAARDSAGRAPQFGSTRVWLAAGLAGAFGATASGATLGALIQTITAHSGLVGLLWALSVFTLLKPFLHFGLKQIWRRGEEVYCGPGLGAPARERERREMEAREVERREMVTVEMEQRILTLEKERDTELAEDPEQKAAWEAKYRERERREREKRERLEEETRQMSVQGTISNVVVKYVDFLAFSGVPMTLTAVVSAGFGLFGFGAYRFVFVVLLLLVLCTTFMLVKSSQFGFWMLAGCMGMLATFTIAILTMHAGHEVVSESIKLRSAGQNQSREDLSSRINRAASLEALGSGLFVARLCQLGFGATVGGPMVRQGAGGGKVIVGAAGVAGLIQVAVGASAPVLGAGGRAGALLGVVGAAGVSVGAAVGLAAGWSSRAGTVGTIAGVVVGALGVGRWHFINIGLQVPLACVFAMTNLF